MGLEEGPLSAEIYAESLVDFKCPANLPVFRGSGDNQDPRSFMFGFRERLRLVGATDTTMCRVFTFCLAGEAWEWYINLPKGSVKKFEDLAKAFLAQYIVIKRPRVTCEMLFDLSQGSSERTRSFVNRFVEASRKVLDLNEEVAVAALRKGLRRGGVGTLRHDAYVRDIRTLGEFLNFAEGYIRAEEDVNAESRDVRRSGDQDPAPPGDRIKG
ncbi:uncharacterized protein LOC144564380 [Carex rostrata]